MQDYESSSSNNKTNNNNNNNDNILNYNFSAYQKKL
jgi:hypothetical protein